MGVVFLVVGAMALPGASIQLAPATTRDCDDNRHR
jgi:hypothetical protein